MASSYSKVLFCLVISKMNIYGIKFNQKNLWLSEDDVARLAWFYCSENFGALQISSTNRNLVPRFKVVEGVILVSGEGTVLGFVF